MHTLEAFFFGSITEMERPSLKWWRGKRTEYNIRLVGYIFFEQFLFAIMAFGLAENGAAHVISKIPGLLEVDLFLVLLTNIMYFLWLGLETTVFRNN